MHQIFKYLWYSRENDEKVNKVHVLMNHRTMLKTKIFHLETNNTKLVIVILLSNICCPISSLISKVIGTNNTLRRSIIDIDLAHLVDQDKFGTIVTSYCNCWDSSSFCNSWMISIISSLNFSSSCQTWGLFFWAIPFPGRLPPHVPYFLLWQPSPC